MKKRTGKNFRFLVILLCLLLTLSACGGKKEAAGASTSSATAEVSETAAEGEPSEEEEATSDDEETAEEEAPEESEEAGEPEESEEAEEETMEVAAPGAANGASAGNAATSKTTAGASASSATAEGSSATAAEAPAPAEETPAPAEEPAAEIPAPSPVAGNGRILFVGDSRTIDMFADSDDPVNGRVEGNITIYAMHARGYDYLTGIVGSYGVDNFDTLVAWMGANDGGNFSNYANFYASLMAQGKKVILCTVGPTDDAHLMEWDHPKYENEKMVAYNASLVNWAAANGVKVIDLYSYIAGNVAIDPADGIHYMPRPTSGIWSVITSSL